MARATIASKPSNYNKDLAKLYARVKVVWQGLTHVEQLAAKYGDCVDYYLLDGKSAIQEAYRDAMALVSPGGDSDAGLAVTEVTERVQKALNVLGRDPHHLYETRFGYGEPPIPPERPGLALSAHHINPGAGTWRAVDVIARCAASTDERPITIKGELTAEPGSEFAKALQAFFDFGAPFTSPAGAYTGEIDAPGGLGGELVKASLKTSAVKGDVPDPVELRLQVLDPRGDVLGEAHVVKTELSQGGLGGGSCSLRPKVSSSSSSG